MMDYFVVEIAQLMFFADSNQNARPMTYYVERPYDIDEQFNRVAYSKGLCFHLSNSVFHRTFFLSTIRCNSTKNVLVYVGREYFHESSEIVSRKQVYFALVE